MQIHNDVVIVGGGAAGCALANRLTVDPGVTVLLLEAGGPSRRWDASWMLGRDRRDRQLRSDPEPHLLGRRLEHPRGRQLGGSGGDGGVYERGHPACYDRWAAELDRPDWDYAHCLPYFRRAERSHGRDGYARHADWPGSPLDHAPAAGPLFDAFFAAAEQAGHPCSAELDHRPEGFAPVRRAVRDGRRVTAGDAYLAPVISRHNLRVECHALVTSIMFRGRRAVGVRYRQGSGPEQQIRAGEVILAGGAISTPQLLQLSGVGHGDELAGLGVPVVAHLPGVGRNAQDHLGVVVTHSGVEPAPADRGRVHRWPAAGWRRPARGVAPTPTEAGGFIRSRPDAAHPDLRLALAPGADGPGYRLHLMAGCPESRGQVRLRSTDPTAPPAVRFDYLATEADRGFWPRALRIGRELLARPAFAALDGGELAPGPNRQSDAELLEWVRQVARGEGHVTSSCRMGEDHMSVVDPGTMRVHGLDRIRVVDASVMPAVPNADTYEPVMMIAEKAADMIVGRAPLRPMVSPSAG